MRKKVLILYLIFLFFFCCKSPTETKKPEIQKKANIVLDGNFIQSMTSYDCPQFSGYVKNIGNNTGYNCKIEIRCFSDPNKTTIIDTASGFPADLGNIDPGQRAYFEAVCFNLHSWDQIKSYDYKIDWLDRI
jgi:hypothetical protein